MTETNVFVLKSKTQTTYNEKSYKIPPTKKVYTYAVVITDTPQSRQFMLAAWNYAVRETSQKMEPVYEDAVEWLRQQHPEWQFIISDHVSDIQFDGSKGSPLYPPT